MPERRLLTSRFRLSGMGYDPQNTWGVRMCKPARGGHHGTALSTRSRRSHARLLRRLARAPAPPLRRCRGRQARSWRSPLPRPCPGLRREDHSPRQARTARARPPGTGTLPEKGGGRHPLTKVFPRLGEAFADLIRDYTAGDPMRPGVQWTNLSLRRIRSDLIRYGYRIGVKSVARLLRHFHF